ncbi:MAG TPA: 6-hydroxymethylpterin diphosphokinase MptE-like protein [Polyangiaceae bacterium]|nr:6-hydroxymethylpterin diphosphokinase MptE-like protein [Polyangiaceae bacterium]
MDGPAVAPRELLSRGFLDDNTALLGLSGATLDLVRSAAPSARVEHFQGGVQALLHRGRVLGLPQNGVPAGSADGVTVVFGLGLGDTVRTLRDAGTAPIVVYEPDASVLRSVLELGPTDLGGVDVVCTLHDLSQLWPALARGRAKATLVRTAGYSEAFPEEERLLIDAIEQLVQRVSVNANTYRVRSQEWIKYTLANLDVLTKWPSFGALAGKFPGVPMFIVGAGPSLARNASLLSVAAKKGIVIAVNTSAKALAAHGVEPQVVACIESIDVTDHLRDLPFIGRAVRAFSLASHPNAFRMSAGPVLPVYEGLPQLSIPLRDLTGTQGLAVCGSVSTLAFSLAQRLGASPIVLVGQDLAFTGGKAYAKGTAYEASSARVSEDGKEILLDWCENVRKTHDAGGTAMHDKEPLSPVTRWGGGGTELSGPMFSFVRAWFEDAAHVIARDLPELRLVNATEGGARIAGFEEVPLADVLEGMPDRNITPERIMASAGAVPVSPERLVAWARAQASLTREVAHNASRVRKFAAHAGRAVRAAKPTRVHRAFDGLERAEQALRDSVARAPLVDAWACAEIDRSMGTSSPPLGVESASSDALRSAYREEEVATIVEESAKALDGVLGEVARRFR